MGKQLQIKKLTALHDFNRENNIVKLWNLTIKIDYFNCNSIFTKISHKHCFCAESRFEHSTYFDFSVIFQRKSFFSGFRNLED